METQMLDATPQQPRKLIRLRVTAQPIKPWKKTYSVPEMYFAEEVPSPYPGSPPILKPRTNVTSRELAIGVPTVMEVEPRLAADLQVDENLKVELLGEDDEAPRQGSLELSEDERALILQRRHDHDQASGTKPKAPKKKSPSKQ